jgi:hypothetical protein
MKRIHLLPQILLALLLTAVGAIAGSGIFNYVKATSQGEDVVVQWRSSAEMGVTNFEIERSSDEAIEFRKLGQVVARGSGNTYTFTDNGAFYKSQSAHRFTYRIKATGQSGDQYSAPTTILHEVSGIRRSWGMIKELFR